MSLAAKFQDIWQPELTQPFKAQINLYKQEICLK